MNVHGKTLPLKLRASTHTVFPDLADQNEEPRNFNKPPHYHVIKRELQTVLAASASGFITVAST
jgi:hypothetical protein